jgi:hypothetical protein
MIIQTLQELCIHKIKSSLTDIQSMVLGAQILGPPTEFVDAVVSGECNELLNGILQVNGYTQFTSSTQKHIEHMCYFPVDKKDLNGLPKVSEDTSTFCATLDVLEDDDNDSEVMYRIRINTPDCPAFHLEATLIAIEDSIIGWEIKNIAGRVGDKQSKLHATMVSAKHDHIMLVRCAANKAFWCDIVIPKETV